MKSETLARIFLFCLVAAASFIGVLAFGPRLGLAALAPGYDYEIHARMPENGGWSEENLRAQVGKPLRLRLTSDDVMHSFALGQSTQPPVDLLPGDWKEVTLTFDQPGRYVFYCTRWCGRNHWRMRGTIIVEGEGTGSTAPETAEKPLYMRLGLNLDAPHLAEVTPSAPPSAGRGAQYASRLPAWAQDRQAFMESSPAAFWQRLRDEQPLKDLDDAALWDMVAYIWGQQVSGSRLAEAQKLYSVNCAACHGETGKGDGVMVEGLPRFDPGAIHPTAESNDSGSGMEMSDGQMAGSEMQLSAPPDFSDPRVLLGASPALLQGKMLRGGMGTGMPYWGPIFTDQQMDAIIAFMYHFAFQNKTE